MFAALLFDHYFHQTAYVYMLGAAFFGGLFVWIMIFVTHLAFRRRTEAAAISSRANPGPLRFAPPGPWSSLAGLTALVAVGISTWWIPGMRITLAAGLPWLAFISLCYLVWQRLRRPAN